MTAQFAVGAEEGSLRFTLFNFFIGTEEGSLWFFLNQGARALFNFATTAVRNALANFGGGVWDMIAVPVIEVLNFVIRAINRFVAVANGALGGIEDFLGSVGIDSSLVQA